MGLMWEPFSEPARRSIVRAQEVAQMFGSASIGTAHMTFALAEADDEVGSALARAVDREAIRSLLGMVRSSPAEDIGFTSGAKQSIELAFANARRLNNNFIGTAHLALGIIGSPDAPPLVESATSDALRAALDLAAMHEQERMGQPVSKRRSAASWKRLEGDGSLPEMAALLETLPGYQEFNVPGARVTITIAVPDKEERSWTWVREGRSES